MENNQTNNQENVSNDKDNLGTAGSEGTQAYNNGNEGESGRGEEESGHLDKKNDDYEGGNLGTAGSGGEEIKNSENLENLGYDRNNHLTNSEEDEQKVAVPTIKDDYEGGNMGTSGSGSMNMHGSESSLSLNALSPENTDEKNKTSNPESKNADGLGSPPLGNIANGSDGGATQPKEHTGKDTEMGGADGGTSGLGNGNDKTGLEGEGNGNKDDSGSASGGGGSSKGSNG